MASVSFTDHLLFLKMKVVKIFFFAGSPNSLDIPPIAVAPPFWQSLWFYELVSFFLLFLAAVVSVYVLMLNREISVRKKAMNRALRLTKQLLTFAKGGDPVKEGVGLGTLVEEVARFDLSGSNIKLVLHQVDDLWLAKVDKEQIQ